MATTALSLHWWSRKREPKGISNQDIGYHDSNGHGNTADPEKYRYVNGPESPHEPNGRSTGSSSTLGAFASVFGFSNSSKRGYNNNKPTHSPVTDAPYSPAPSFASSRRERDGPIMEAHERAVRTRTVTSTSSTSTSSYPITPDQEHNPRPSFHHSLLTVNETDPFAASRGIRPLSPPQHPAPAVYYDPSGPPSPPLSAQQHRSNKITKRPSAKSQNSSSHDHPDDPYRQQSSSRRGNTADFNDSEGSGRSPRYQAPEQYADPAYRMSTRSDPTTTTRSSSTKRSKDKAPKSPLALQVQVTSTTHQSSSLAPDPRHPKERSHHSHNSTKPQVLQIPKGRHDDGIPSPLPHMDSFGFPEPPSPSYFHSPYPSGMTTIPCDFSLGLPPAPGRNRDDPSYSPSMKGVLDEVMPPLQPISLLPSLSPNPRNPLMRLAAASLSTLSFSSSSSHATNDDVAESVENKRGSSRPSSSASNGKRQKSDSRSKKDGNDTDAQSSRTTKAPTRQRTDSYTSTSSTTPSVATFASPPPVNALLAEDPNRSPRKQRSFAHLPPLPAVPTLRHANSFTPITSSSPAPEQSREEQHRNRSVSPTSHSRSTQRQDPRVRQKHREVSIISNEDDAKSVSSFQSDSRDQRPRHHGTDGIAVSKVWDEPSSDLMSRITPHHHPPSLHPLGRAPPQATQKSGLSQHIVPPSDLIKLEDEADVTIGSAGWVERERRAAVYSKTGQLPDRRDRDRERERDQVRQEEQSIADEEELQSPSSPKSALRTLSILSNTSAVSSPSTFTTAPSARSRRPSAASTMSALSSSAMSSPITTTVNIGAGGLPPPPRSRQPRTRVTSATAAIRPATNPTHVPRPRAATRTGDEVSLAPSTGSSRPMSLGKRPSFLEIDSESETTDSTIRNHHYAPKASRPVMNNVVVSPVDGSFLDFGRPSLDTVGDNE